MTRKSISLVPYIDSQPAWLLDESTENPREWLQPKCFRAACASTNGDSSPWSKTNVSELFSRDDRRRLLLMAPRGFGKEAALDWQLAKLTTHHPELLTIRVSLDALSREKNQEISATDADRLVKLIVEDHLVREWPQQDGFTQCSRVVRKYIRSNRLVLLVQGPNGVPANGIESGLTALNRFLHHEGRGCRVILTAHPYAVDRQWEMFADSDWRFARLGPFTSNQQASVLTPEVYEDLSRLGISLSVPSVANSLRIRLQEVVPRGPRLELIYDALLEQLTYTRGEGEPALTRNDGAFVLATMAMTSLDHASASAQLEAAWNEYSSQFRKRRIHSREELTVVVRNLLLGNPLLEHGVCGQNNAVELIQWQDESLQVLFAALGIRLVGIPRHLGNRMSHGKQLADKAIPMAKQVPDSLSRQFSTSQSPLKSSGFHIAQRRAVSCMRNGDFAEARRLLDEIAIFAPQDLESRFLHALCNMLDFESATANDPVAKLVDCLRQNPDHVDSLVCLAAIAAVSGESATSQAYARRAIILGANPSIISGIVPRQTKPIEVHTLSLDLVQPQFTFAHASIQDRVRLAEWSQQILAQWESRNLPLKHWIEEYFPWSRLGNRPILDAACACAVCFTIITATQLPGAHYDRILQQSIIWILIWMGLSNAFRIRQYLANLYPRIIPAFNSHPDVIREFYLTQAAHILGTTYDTDSGTWKTIRLRRFWHWFTTGSLCLLQIGCANDSLVVDSVGAAVPRFISYFLQAWVVAWLFPMIVYSSAFIPRDWSRMSVRFFPGIPDDTSIRQLTGVYVYMAWLGAIAFPFFMAQHFVFETIRIPANTIIYTVLCVVWFVMIVFSSNRVTHVLREARRNRAIECSDQVEISFRNVIGEPSEANIAKWRNARNFLEELTGTSVSGLTKRDAIRLFIAGATVVLCLVAYAALIALRVSPSDLAKWFADFVSTFSPGT